MKNKKSKAKIIKNKQEKICSICGKKIKVIFYTNRSYQGGYFFGKIPISTKREWRRVLKLGTTIHKIGDFKMDVLKEDPKPYKFLEYWECPKCYIN